jgi:hypothetical protein
MGTGTGTTACAAGLDLDVPVGGGGAGESCCASKIGPSNKLAQVIRMIRFMSRKAANLNCVLENQASDLH